MFLYFWLAEWTFQHWKPFVKKKTPRSRHKRKPKKTSGQKHQTRPQSTSLLRMCPTRQLVFVGGQEIKKSRNLKDTIILFDAEILLLLSCFQMMLTLLLHRLKEVKSNSGRHVERLHCPPCLRESFFHHFPERVFKPEPSNSGRGGQ